MSLNIQIKTIFFSIFFGFIFSLVLGFNYRFIIGNKKVLSPILTLLLVIVFTLLYFIILNNINCGIFHIYEIFCIFFGFLFENLVVGFVEKKSKK